MQSSVIAAGEKSSPIILPLKRDRLVSAVFCMFNANSSEQPMTKAEEIPDIDTVGDLIKLLQTVSPESKFRVSVGLVLLKKEDGTILIDNGVQK